MSANIVGEYAEKYGKELSALCFSLCRNTHDAEDLYQDTWIKVISGIESYRERGDFRKWLFTVCCNTFRDTYRKKLRENSVCFDSTEHMDRFFETLPDLTAEEAKDYTELYRAIDELPPKLRIALSLRYFSALSEEDIAEVLGISYSASRARISRAVKKLADIMNGGKQ